MYENLSRLGWSEACAQSLRALSDDSLLPARVVAQHRGAIVVAGAVDGPVPVRDEAPAVGDWVALAPGPTLAAVLPRRTVLARQAAGRRTERQVIAANVDRVLITVSMNADLSVRRVERYVAAIRSGGAEAVIVVTKADLDLANVRRHTAGLPDDVPTVVTSAVLDLGLDEVAALVPPGTTVALVGSSGVGKSTLLNHLLGRDVQRTIAVRDDGTGRHATTHRALFVLPDGGLVVDTPGLRELALWDADGVGLAFPEIDALADACRFRDCGHDTEPGCAVQAAIAEGALDAGRLASWRKLAREAARHEERVHDQNRRARRWARAVAESHRLRGKR